MEVEPGYKQTDIGVIPDDWDIKSIRSIAKIIGGGTPATSVSEYWDGNIYWVAAGDVSNAEGRYVQDTEYRITELGLQSCSANLMPKGTTVIIARGATVGRMAQLGKEMTFNQTCYGLRPMCELDQNYLYYSMLFSVNYIKALTYGTIFGTITTNSFDDWKIPLPLLPEQRAIAAALSDVDSLLSALDALLAKKRLIKQGAMQELLTGRRRLLDFKGKWVLKPLRNVANIQRGASPRPIDSPMWFDENSSVGWVRISDVTKSGMYLSETSQRLSQQGIEHSRPVSRDSLIMSICATVGRPVITKIDTCIHDGFVVFDNLRAEKHFLYYVLKSIEDKWSRHGQTGSQMNLNTEIINRTEVFMPPTTKEQIAITEILSDMDVEIAALAARREKTRLLKQGMMQELLTGRVRLV